MLWMLDTNICSFVIKRRSELLLREFHQHDHATICVSAITTYELYAGCERSPNRERLFEKVNEFLQPFPVLAFEDKDSRQAAVIRAELERAGTPISACDVLLAAHALNHNLTLVTNNTREFKRVKGLKLADWSV
jgi:tRNA(fMet)-specific endonuclease VapC